MDGNKEREHKLNGTWSNLKPIEKSCGCRTTTLLPKTNVTKAKTGAQLPGPSWALPLLLALHWPQCAPVLRRRVTRLK